MADELLKIGQASPSNKKRLKDQGDGTVAEVVAAVLQAATAVVGQVGIDQTTPGSTNLVEARPSARRTAGVLHRNAITAADKLTTPSVPATSDQTASGGGLAISTTYYVAIAAGNRWGTTLPCAPTPQATSGAGGATHSVRATFGQTAGADYYDLFLSISSTGPLWVGRVTEAQRAAGGVINAVGVYGAGGVAGAIDIGVVGTGAASNANPFLAANAYTPAAVAGVGSINCAGRSKAHLHFKLALSDLRNAPTLTIIPFTQDQISPNDWMQGALQTVFLATGNGQSLEQDFELVVDGAPALVVLIDALTGQGATVSIWVELV